MPQSIAEKQYVTTRGYRTHYLEAGQGDPLILIHGGGAGADAHGNWRGCLPVLAAHYRTIAYDMVGFGQSDAPDPANFAYSQEERIEQAIAFAEALGLTRANWIGNSMGGATSLGVAMRRPDLVRNLVLMGSAGLNHETGGAVASLLNYDFTLDGMRKIVATLANPSFVPDEDLLRKRYELSIRPEKQAAYKAIMGAIRVAGGLHYAEADIAKVKARTLVVQGKDDKIIPLTAGLRFLELLDNSYGYFLPNCGHWAMIEHPKAFVDQVMLFLSSDRS